MLPPDNHVHSQWSFDAGGMTSMAETCARAVQLGLPGLAFTEHVEFRTPSPGDAVGAEALEPIWWPQIAPLDVTGYLASIEECRRRYPQLRIWTGIEAGEPHLFAASIAAVLATGPFERILGSLHTITHDGRLHAADKLFGTLTPGDLMRRYFTELISLIKGSEVFEVLAHLDYPRRHWPFDARPYREADYEEEYRAVLRTLAGSGRVLEFNTKSPFASVDLIRWWHEEGGGAVSFGADGHRPWLVGARFELAVDIVEQAGFKPGRDPLDFWRR